MPTTRITGEVACTSKPITSDKWYTNKYNLNQPITGITGDNGMTK